jgi:hypothetical protein
VAYLFAGAGALGDTQRFSDPAHDSVGGGARADLIAAGTAHGHGHLIKHFVRVRGKLGPRKTWPYLHLDDGDSTQFLVNPWYHGGTFWEVDAVIHIRPTTVRKVSAHKLVYFFDPRWMEEGIRQYCWTFATDISNTERHDAMPDRVEPGYTHVIRPHPESGPC